MPVRAHSPKASVQICPATNWQKFAPRIHFCWEQHGNKIPSFRLLICTASRVGATKSSGVLVGAERIEPAVLEVREARTATVH